MSNDDENKFKQLLIIGSIISIVGAIGIILGEILGFGVFTGDEVHVFGFITIAISAGIFLVSLLTLFGTLNIGFRVNDERPALLALSLFIFAPTIIISNYTTPLFYLLKEVNKILVDTGAQPSYNFYFLIAGAGLLLFAFVFHTWIFLWKKRITILSSDIAEESEIGFIKGLRIIASILVLISGIGIILAMVIPIYTSLIDPNIPSLLMSNGDNNYLDLQALFFIIQMFIIALTALLVLLGNFGVIKAVKGEIPLVILGGLILITPGYMPETTEMPFWTSPIYELLTFARSIVNDENSSLGFMAWIMLSCIGALVVAIFLSAVSYFFSKSALPVSRAPRTAKVKTQKVKTPRSKFPTGPPSAQPQVGGLASQLSASSGPPSGSFSGPPSMGQQPTVSSSPPSPPSFMPSSGPPAADKPICPFCGKPLRYIDEYARWYCDACAQYV
ncbi:MAG: hypothetical protein ACFFDW_10490 [Candidatus Thorarchaeota archaeon]